MEKMVKLVYVAGKLRGNWWEKREFIKVSDVDLLEVRSSEKGETDE